MKPQAQINIFDEIIVDNFAGGGGASTGIELATGRPVTAAINHDPDAILMHQTNHPYTRHYCESVWDIDPRKVCAGRPVGLAWFSPDCKHFSKAKGGKPVDKHIRGLAWVVLRWAALVRPRVIMLENVEEFQTWGPVRRGRPVKSKSGQTFRKWRSQLEALGYSVDMRELRACDFGAPTIRKRFFVVARCDGRPVVWPEPTHGAPDSPDVLAGRLKPWRTAAEIIDWSLPCPSIFDTSEEIFEKYGVRAVRPLAENTLRRIARGIQKFVLDNPRPYIVQCNHSGENFRGQDAAEPLQTITGKHGYGVVTPILAGVGGRAGQSRPRGVEEPIATTTAKADVALITPVVSPWTVTNTTNSTGERVDEPLGTVRTGGGGGQMFVSPTLIQYHSEQGGREVRGQGMEAPLFTVDGANRFGLVAATMIQTGYGEAPGQLPRAPGIEKPLGTSVSTGKHALVSAFLSKYYDGGYRGAGSALDDPVHTVTPQDHNALAAAHLVKLKGQDVGQPADVPLHTVTAGGNHFGEVVAFLMKYYGKGEGQSVDEPAHTVTSRDRMALVTVQGVDYAIVDIGLRMLISWELYRANGFPLDYIIDRDYLGNPYSKSKQVARCGNSVPPPFAAALVRANLPELCTGQVIGSMAELEEHVAL